MVLSIEQDTECHSSRLSELEKLPLHILTLICGHLARPQNGNLLAFAQTSRTCHHAAEIDRFRRIQITVGSTTQVCDTVQRLRDVLGVGCRMNLVRVLKIKGAESMEEDKEYLQGRPFIHIKMEGWDDEDEELQDLCSPADQMRTYRPVYFPWPSEIKKKWNNICMPIINLCKDLHRLKDIIWAVSERFPSALLSAIHKHHPASRLHMPTFLLRSLITEEEDLEPRLMDPDEVALATSPCLYSLVVETADYSDFDWVDHNHDAVLAMLGGAAPNLAHVLIRRASTLWGDEEELLVPSRPTWPGFPDTTWPLNGETQMKRHIQSLCIDRVPATPDFLSQWGDHTDFRKLHSLEIKGTIISNTIQHLLELARGGILDALHSLSLLDSNIVDYRGDFRGEVGGPMAELLQTLKPLQNLKLNHRLVNREVGEAVISHHAPSLQTLSLLPQYQKGLEWVDFLTGLAQEIAQKCLGLKELEIIVPGLRDKAAQKQVAVYRSLGRLPRLERLTLRLDCAVRYSPSLLRTVLVVPTLSNPDHVVVQDAFRNKGTGEGFDLEIASIMSHNDAEMHTLVIDPHHFPPVYPADVMGKWGLWVGKRWATRKTTSGDTEIFATGEERRTEFGKVLRGAIKRNPLREGDLGKVLKRAVMKRVSR